MDAVPHAVVEYLNKSYPKPKVDPEWLTQCYEWIIEEHSLNPLVNLPEIIQQVELQLLESNLSDSMLPGTGLPPHLADVNTAKTTLTGPPVLVEITSITEVGVSAHQLNKTRMVREERMAAGAEEEGEADEDVEGEGPIPTYPRSMLKLELSDGATLLKAMEYKPLPVFQLGSTPLGSKLLLKNVLVRRGVAFLEPACIEVKGYRNQDRDALREFEFTRGLHLRLGLPPPDPPPQIQAASPPPPDPERMRSPLREISPPPSPTLAARPDHTDDLEQPRRRKVPSTQDQSQDPPAHTSATPAPSLASSSTLVPSPFFSTNASAAMSLTGTSVAPSRNNTAEPAPLGLQLSPTRRPREPILIEDDEGEGDLDGDVNMSPSKSSRRPASKAPSIPPGPAPAKMGQEDEEFRFSDDDEIYNESVIDIITKVDESENARRLAGASSAAPAPVPARANSQARSNQGPVIISDSEDEDDLEMEDKENVPAAKRSVKRKLVANRRSIVPEDDVIEID